MWTTKESEVARGSGKRFRLLEDGTFLSYRSVLDHWQFSADFRSFFLKLLAGSPFKAYRWETPPLTAASAHQPFEFVLMDSPSLDREPDEEAFSDRFQENEEAMVIEFENLGGDATLIVPTPNSVPSSYVHIASFSRQAPIAQQHVLWQTVGRAALERMTRRPNPVWVSTAGGGVAWLHVRLDDRPKYYSYAPYRTV